MNWSFVIWLNPNSVQRNLNTKHFSATVLLLSIDITFHRLCYLLNKNPLAATFTKKDMYRFLTDQFVNTQQPCSYREHCEIILAISCSSYGHSYRVKYDILFKILDILANISQYKLKLDISGIRWDWWAHGQGWRLWYTEQRGQSH